MILSQRFALVVALLSTLFSFNVVLGSIGVVQKPGLTLPSNAAQRRSTVKQIFRESFAAYTKFAYGHDDLTPVTKGFTDSRNGWGATIVDSMSTMKIMGLDDLFNQAVTFVSKIDFSKSNTADTVSVFESTIRYMGGLLSAFELSGKQHTVLVNKAKQLADKLSKAWVGLNDLPYGHVDFSKGTPNIGTSNIAEAGTLTIEWSTLSKYTGVNTYRILAEKSVRHIANSAHPLPGLPAQGIDPSTGSPVGGYVTWGGGSDSYFEYLIKYARLSGTSDPLFVNNWMTAVDSSIKTLLKTSTIGEHVYLADYTDLKQIRHVGSHLECFHGGNWILGGKLLQNNTIFDYGLQLVDACWNTYASTATGIGPEIFAYASADGNYTGGTPSPQDEAFYNKHGFYIYQGGADYILRPEVLESNFYAWRATGDKKYQDRAAQAMANFQKYLKIQGSEPGLYSGILNVDNTNIKVADRFDDTESFWFAEVLKYLYLTFDDPKHISLDQYVFNTEAHPFLAPTSVTFPSSTGSISPASLPVPLPAGTNSGPLPEVSAIPGLPNPATSVSNLVAREGSRRRQLGHRRRFYGAVDMSW